MPKAAQYAMRIFVGSGTEIPQFTDVTNFGKNKKMSVLLSPLAPHVDNFPHLPQPYTTFPRDLRVRALPSSLAHTGRV